MKKDWVPNEKEVAETITLLSLVKYVSRAIKELR